MTRGRLPRATPLAIALLVAPLLFAVNYTANHLWPLPGRLGYALVVILLAGTVLPSVTLLTLARRGAIDLRAWGYAARPHDALKIVGALAVGGVLAAFAIGEAARAEPALMAHRFVWLLAASMAEALVFLGIVYNVVETVSARWLPRWIAVVPAAAVSSAAFGAYHFSYPAPWNTTQVALTLFVVWREVTAVFVITRSLWAATVFNGVMAVIGFTLNTVTWLDGEPLSLGLALAALSVLVVAGLAAVLRAPGPRHAVASR